MGFTGIPAAGVEFYERLGADNTKTFWQANRSTFDEQVRRPMTELCEALEGYGPFNLFRPHNDLRFSKNKPPYKTHQGAYGESEGGAGHYLQLSAQGLMCAAGYYAMAADQLARFRSAVDDASTVPRSQPSSTSSPAGTRSARSTSSRPRLAVSRRTIRASCSCVARG